MTKFILYATQRTGSTWVMDSIDHHPSIRAYVELFLRNRRVKFDYGPDDVPCYKNSNMMLEPYLDKVLSRHDASCVGFKLMYEQCVSGMWEWCVDNDVRVIHLVRNNTLDVILSRMAVRIRGRHSRKEGSAKNVRIHVDVGRLPEDIHRVEKQVSNARAHLAKLQLKTIEVGYEDIVASGLTSVFEFLGVDVLSPRKTISSFRKMNTQSHSEMIINGQQVYDALTKMKRQSLWNPS